MLQLVRPAFATAFIFCTLAACSGGGSGDDGAGASGASGGSGGAGASGGSGSSSGGGGSGGSGGGGALGGPFRYGVNYGFPNPGWNDQDLAFLSHEAGSNSARLKLSEQHLDTWGYDIEVGDMKGYASLGMGEHVAFLGVPTVEHATAPAGTPSWELEHYIPKNLYEPVFNGDGSINPNNYWGAYVYQTVTTYKPWVRVWEVWNEPDWVSDWQVTQTWETEPPTKEQLVRFGGSIYDYVRMLRVSFEAAKKADPEARIALGGIGYPSFLSAVLRYTDNPSGGAVTNDYPKTGSSYFDVVSFHYYPVFGPGSSDEGVAGFLKLKSDLDKKLTDAGVTGKGWIVTETGAPHVAVGGAPGGAEYAPNYLVKVMTAAQTVGVERIDWFCLSDGKAVGASTNSFDYMGLYVDVSKLGQTSEAVRTEAGRAYRTLGKLLEGALFDKGGTTALGLPDTVGGAAFRLPDMRRAFVLWARTKGGSETASASYSLAAEGSYETYGLDFSDSGAVETLSPDGGKITLTLDGAPRIYVQKP
ncbi:hypothetical protein [Polyangium mundeleinium]|uniref:Beta-xylosidase n=1 Tax=Polyangium mundeleinium TaxID=2995306 RepID=A0ABT5F8J1_9BACT|nr:hypothetical protein [Polyangium mundeleinium]MDC0749426.1 hypothetical protein [Polyangium mundeleinium]